MNRATKTFLCFASVYIAAILVFGISMSLIFGPIECKSRWEGSGYEKKYSLFSGCLVKHDKLGWIPEDNVRVID